MLSLLAGPAVAASAASQRAADAHVIRPVRGDVFVVVEEPVSEPTHRRAGLYVAPFSDWRYSAVRPGHRLRPEFYGRRYVVAEPAAFQLRAARGDQRWIRYGDDVLLVDANTGLVIEVSRQRYQ